MTTLFAREHNRIAAALPADADAEERFQIARRVVAAEEQYITYTEFLPALGVTLSPYHGYDPSVNSELSDEFATIGFRLHSMVNSSLELAPAHYSGKKVAAMQALGLQVVVVSKRPKQMQVTIPQGAAFFDPAVVPAAGLGQILEGLWLDPAVKNDEQVGDALRSVMFGIPGPGTDPAACFGEPVPAGCFSVVEDLAAVDIQRSRDNGMPTYDELREALGLPPQSTFAQVTGEASEDFPTGDPLVPATDAIDDPHILDFTSLKNLAGEPIAPGSPERAVYAHAAHDAGREAEGDLRVGREPRRVRRHGVRAASSRQRPRRTAGRSVAPAVRSAARRRPLLLPERSRARSHQARIRDHVQALALRPHHARRGRPRGAARAGNVHRARTRALIRRAVGRVGRPDDDLEGRRMSGKLEQGTDRREFLGRAAAAGAGVVAGEARSARSFPPSRRRARAA